MQEEFEKNNTELYGGNVKRQIGSTRKTECLLSTFYEPLPRRKSTMSSRQDRPSETDDPIGLLAEIKAVVTLKCGGITLKDQELSAADFHNLKMKKGEDITGYAIRAEGLVEAFRKDYAFRCQEDPLTYSSCTSDEIHQWPRH